MKMKSEIRNPKSETNPKLEFQNHGAPRTQTSSARETFKPTTSHFPTGPLSHLPFLLATLILSLLSSGCDHSAPINAPLAVQAPEVQLVRPAHGPIGRNIVLPGQVLADQHATLYAKVAGYLKTITVDKGDSVEQGALLAEIEIPELLADQAKAKAEMELAALEFKRVSEAQEKAPDLIVRQSVDTAKAKFDVAKASLERLETLLGFARITAPFPGVIVRRFVDRGAFIPAATSGSAAQNAALLTLMDFRQVRVQVAVPELEVPRIVKGLPVQIILDELAARTFSGSITRYAHALDDATKTMLAEIVLPNPNLELRPGMFATVKIEVDRKPNVLLIPVDALVAEKNRSSIFTVDQGKTRRLIVKTGFNDGQFVEIVEGLDPTQEIIRLGKMTLTDAQPVKVASKP